MIVKFTYPEQLKTRKYRHKLFVIPCEEKKKRLSCIICNDILVDPHQTECGCRCCHYCLDDLRRCEDRCPGCNDVITSVSDKVRPDKAVEREIFDLEIRCPNERCDHKCQLKKLSEHLEMCEFRVSKCDKCEEHYPYKDRSTHTGFQCKMIMIKCDQCGSEMTKKDLDGIHRNIEVNIDNVCDNWKGVCPLGCCGEVQDNVKVHLGVCPRVTVECTMKELGCTKKLPRIDMNTHIETDLAVHARLMSEEISRLRKEREDLECHLAETERKETVTIDALKRSVEELSHKVATLINRALTSERLLVNEQFVMNHVKQPILTSRDSASSLPNQCSFEWRVPDVHEKIENAKAGKNVTLVSDSFYAGRPGPRICLKMYPYGDGSGQGSHLSVYFVLMRGEYDGDIAWPFSRKVSLSLRSNKGFSNDLTVNMKPDHNNSCYGRPKNNHNVAAGQPRFLSHSDLTKYITNGSIVIRITVL